MMNVNSQERQKLRELAHGFYFSCSLFATVRLGLADAFEQGAKSIQELATHLNANLDALKRLVSFMISLNVMEEKEGRINLTETGKFLSSKHPQSLAREIAMFSGEETYRAWGDVLFSIRTGGPAFNNVYGSPLFEYFSSHEDTAKRFHEGWQEITTVTAREFVQAYNFTDGDTVLDIGSGYGIFLCTIIKENSRLSGALYDLPISLEGAGEVIKKYSLENKISIIHGNAMQNVPTSFNIHLLKSVIHNCSDQQTIEILSNCSSSLVNGGKVLIVERIVPANNNYHWSKLVDMTMLVMTGGRERTEQEYSMLLEKSGLKMSKVISLPSGFSIIESCKK